MIREEGTDEQLLECVETALLPPVGSVWAFGEGRRCLTVIRVDVDVGIIHAKLDDNVVLNFQYTLRYWRAVTAEYRRIDLDFLLLTCSQTP